MDNQGVTQVEVSMTNLVSRFVRDESGATAIEYGLIAALVSIAIIVALQALGPQLATTFTSITTALAGA